MANVENFTMDNTDSARVEKKKTKSKRNKRFTFGQLKKKTRVGKPLKNGKPRKPHKFRPGTVALREIRRFQNTGALLLPRLPFERLVREIMQDSSTSGLRIQADAVNALQAEAEDFLTKLLGRAYKGALREKRVTLISRDLRHLAESQMGDGPIAIILREALGIAD